jgi:phage terminase large subunit-like protein
MPAKARPPEGVAAAISYAHAVAGGDIPAGALAVLSCERFLRDHAAAEAGEGPWEFRPDLVDRAIHFVGLMTNIKGPEAGKPLRLMAWQRLIFANIFGFVARGTTTRRFRQGIVFVPRGNGKTSLAAPIALYLTFMDGEGGAEGYAAAVTRDQARILWETAREMVRRAPEFRRRMGVEVGARAIYQERSASNFVAVSSDAKALDGLNVQVAVCDEIASHKTSEVYDVLLTAMGKRKHPLLLSISTATGNNSGIGKQLWDYAVRVLDGTQDDDRLFALIYAADDTDDPWEEATWIKANPSWGQAVQPDAIRAIMRQARNNPAQESAARTRHLNIWVGADEALFSMRAWREQADPDLSLDDFEGQDCHLAIDLASKTDLAALALVFPRKDPDTGRMDYAAFARCYLNEAAVMEARNPSYPGWAADGYLVVTPGNETDFATIEADVLAMGARFKVASVAYDPWAATQFAQRLQAEGVPVVEFRASTQNFSEPTKELDAAMRSGRIRHDGNPVLEWCLGNVVGRHDARDNVYPKKSRPEQKIDAAVALIMGVGRSLAAAEPEPEYQMLFVS